VDVAALIGDPLDREAFVGPVVNGASVARFESAVASARAEGSLVAGGGRPRPPGNFVEPTVVSDLPRGHALERDELFLPFVTVTRVSSFDEALAEANAPVYGLTAGVFSQDEAELDRFLDEIDAGVVYVNRRAGATTDAWPGTQTFCGWKSSGATGKGRPRPVLPGAAHARAEPDRGELTSSASATGNRKRRAYHRVSSKSSPLARIGRQPLSRSSLASTRNAARASELSSSGGPASPHSIGGDHATRCSTPPASLVTA
jgi:delta 1-pyrroline-5-carboxylate dehydrogenase